MNTRITIDSAGRIVLPKPLRKALCLETGDALELSFHGEKISLRPVREVPALQKEKGVWVYRTGKPLSAAAVREVREQLRHERSDLFLGLR